MHTYIIGHYYHSVRIIDLVSHTTYDVCFNFYTQVTGDLQFKVDSERQVFFWETFRGSFYLLAEFLPEKCWDVWPGTRTLALRLISQHTTYSILFYDIICYYMLLHDILCYSKLFCDILCYSIMILYAITCYSMLF